MMRIVALVVVVAVVAAAAPALAQEEAVEVQRTAQQEEWFERMDMLKQMGMGDEQALFFSMLTSGDMDATQMMLLMAMMDGGGNMEDALGMMMFMNAMGNGDAAKQPVVLDRGETLLILEDGVLYKINLEEMALAGSVAYAKGGGMDDLLPLLRLMAVRRQERPRPQAVAVEPPVEVGPAMDPEQAECRNNGRQLGLALQMYVEDAGGVLPGEDWAEKLFAYAVNDQVFMCPSRPDVAVAYAMNEKLVGARLVDIADVGQAVVFFESNLGGENPVGGPEAVPEQGVHDGLVNVVFLDGHCNSVPPDEAKELLGETLPNQ